MKALASSFLAIFALSACVGGGGSGSGGVSTAQLTSPVAMVPIDNSFTSMLNGVRADNGSNPLTYDARLGQAAQKHANDMLAMGRMTHTGSDGSSAGQRISREGYNWIRWGENVARGQQTEAAVLNAWVNSPGHQQNNIDPNFEDFALAKAGSGGSLYWALVFATER